MSLLLSKMKCIHSEEDELFLDVSFDSLGFDSKNVESDSLGEGSALSNSDNVSFSQSLEGR